MRSGRTRRRAIAGRPAVLGLIVGSAAGAVLYGVYPFGEPPAAHRPIAGETVLNGLLLALAPVIAILIAYRPVRVLRLEPYGLASDPVLGGRAALPLSLVVTSVFPAVAYARHETAAGIGSSVVLFGSWIALLEVQRRLRRVVDGELDTNRRIDVLQTHVEAFPIALLWILGFIGTAIAGGRKTTCVTAIVVVVILAPLLAYTSAWLQSMPASLAGVSAFVSALGLALGVRSALADVAAALLAILGTVLLERTRRRRLSDKVESLIALGKSDALQARYGADFADIPSRLLSRSAAARLWHREG